MMFKAEIRSFVDIPLDFNRDIFSTEDGVEEYYEDYLVIRVNGKTIFCRPEKELPGGYRVVLNLMELSYNLGVLEAKNV